MDKLNDSTVIHKIANELGLKRHKDCQNAIREFCIQKVENIRDQEIVNRYSLEVQRCLDYHDRVRFERIKNIISDLIDEVAK